MNKTYASADRPLVARWETRGNDWLELTGDAARPGCYWYAGPGMGGSFNAKDDEAALAHIQGKHGAATVLKMDRPSLRRVR